MDMDLLRSLAAQEPEDFGPLAMGRVTVSLFAKMQGVTENAVFVRLRRHPEQYPNLYQQPGARRHFFLIEELQAWAQDSFRPVARSAPPPRRSPDLRQPSRRRGRPTKAEVCKAEKAGLSVSEYRAKECAK